jgi:calcium-dependent protein kinase
MVLEKCDGGELFYEISNKGYLTEHVSAVICKQLFSCVLYLHENQIVHRDLKPENILLEDREDAMNIKLIDFGTAVELSKKSKMNELIGSSYYISPEVINGSYDEKCDVWSLGVILYILLCGLPPFTGNTTKQIMSKINAGKYSLEGKIWDSVSTEAKDLIKRLLCPAANRISAADALNHPWIRNKGRFPRPDPSIVEAAVSNLKAFNSLNKFRDAISTFITSQIISIHETKDLRNIFKNIDVNGDGKLSKEELIKGLAGQEQETPEDFDSHIEKIIREVDTDGNGFIDYNEFIKATISQKKIYSKENLRKAFDLFDLDASGKISSVELQKIFSMGEVADSLWSELVNQADKNFDGEIDFEEFCEFISQLSGADDLFKINNG